MISCFQDVRLIQHFGGACAVFLILLLKEKFWPKRLALLVGCVDALVAILRQGTPSKQQQVDVPIAEFRCLPL